MQAASGLSLAQAMDTHLLHRLLRSVSVQPPPGFPHQQQPSAVVAEEGVAGGGGGLWADKLSCSHLDDVVRESFGTFEHIVDNVYFSQDGEPEQERDDGQVDDQVQQHPSQAAVMSGSGKAATTALGGMLRRMQLS